MLSTYVKHTPLMGKIADKGKIKLSYILNGYDGQKATVNFFVDKMRPKENADSEEVLERRVINDSIDLTEDDIAKWKKGNDDTLTSLLLSKLQLQKEK